MTQHRDFAPLDTFPAGFVDALEEFLSTHASPFLLIAPTTTSIAIKTPNGVDPGTGNDQVSLGINGRWRYVRAAVNASVPGGLPAGTHDIYVGAPDNNPTQEDAGTFNYAFTLNLMQSGTTPATAIYRKIGTFVWSGSAITSIRQTVGAALIGDGSVSTAMLAAASVTKPKLATDALNAFLKLAIAGDVKANFGRSTAFAGFNAVGDSSTVTVPHGLGGVPSWAHAIQAGGGHFTSGVRVHCSVRIEDADATNMVIDGTCTRQPIAPTVTADTWWIAFR